MATVEQVRANQGAWADKEVVVTLKSGERIEGGLDPQIGAFVIGGEFVDESEIQDISLKKRRAAPAKAL